ncbi:MAG: hypothetical protein ACOY5C_14240 [Pseudomonadota bacterium]|uniref:hypothetical protein n=1 Tax=Thermithiobacillus tepidarius TaxID=929 RepID=UPI0012DBDAAD|nr:hypothetical protein [Thermithiobacillus tepidarius]
MQKSKLGLRLLPLLTSLAVAGCGGDSSTTTATTSTVIAGTAAGGAPIVGTVTIKDSLGSQRSAQIQADGSYRIDVSGMTALSRCGPAAPSAAAPSTCTPPPFRPMSAAPSTSRLSPT